MNDSKFPIRRASCVVVVLGTLLFSMLADAQRGGGARAGGGGGATRTSVNHNVQANRNVNANVNRNVNVDVDRHDHYHPVATAAAVATTAAVIGSMVYSIPPSCSSMVVNGVSYQQCGSSWYQPQYVGSQVTYVVVNPPN